MEATSKSRTASSERQNAAFPEACPRIGKPVTANAQPPAQFIAMRHRTRRGGFYIDEIDFIGHYSSLV
jgi:hypothetical protein